MDLVAQTTPPSNVVLLRTFSRSSFWLAQHDAYTTRVERLRQWVDMRMPYPQIAHLLGTTVGAVCGKVARLRIGKGAPTTRITLREHLHSGGQPAGWRQPAVDPEFYEIMRQQKKEAALRQGHTVHIDDLEPHHCRAVIGEPKDQQWCGRTKVPGISYCDMHARLYLENWAPAVLTEEHYHEPERVAA